MKSGWLFLALYSLTVVFRLWYFRQRGWRSPLKSGGRYFLEVEVPDGWHLSAEGKRWWRRYRATLAVRGDAEIHWRMPVTFTYLIVGLAAIKVGVVRQGWALPVERTLEYERWQNVRRKQAARVLDGMRWMLAVAVCGYAVAHSMGGTVPLEPVRWTFIAAAVALWLWMMLAFARGERALDRAGAGLPPAAMAIDWRKGWWSFGAFMAGLAALLIWPW